MPTTQVIIGDCRTVMPTLAPVDLVITSPPYFEKNGWTKSLMKDFGALLKNTLKPNARAWVNFGQVAEDYRRPYITQDAIADSLTTLQTCGWCKSLVIDGYQRGHYTPINSKTKLNYVWEFLFQFCNGNSPLPLNRLSAGVPFSDQNNLTRGTRGKNGDLHCSGDFWNLDIEESAWFIPYATTGKTDKKEHEYQFPQELVRRIINLSNLPEGATILDPFAGSNTVGKVAYELGFNSIAIELDETKVKYRGPV